MAYSKSSPRLSTPVRLGIAITAVLCAALFIVGFVFIGRSCLNARRRRLGTSRPFSVPSFIAGRSPFTSRPVSIITQEPTLPTIPLSPPPRLQVRPDQRPSPQVHFPYSHRPLPPSNTNQRRFPRPVSTTLSIGTDDVPMVASRPLPSISSPSGIAHPPSIATNSPRRPVPTSSSGGHRDFPWLRFSSNVNLVDPLYVAANPGGPCMAFGVYDDNDSDDRPEQSSRAADPSTGHLPSPSSPHADVEGFHIPVTPPKRPIDPSHFGRNEEDESHQATSYIYPVDHLYHPVNAARPRMAIALCDDEYLVGHQEGSVHACDFSDIGDHSTRSASLAPSTTDRLSKLSISTGVEARQPTTYTTSTPIQLDTFEDAASIASMPSSYEDDRSSASPASPDPEYRPYAVGYPITLENDATAVIYFDKSKPDQLHVFVGSPLEIDATSVEEKWQCEMARSPQAIYETVMEQCSRPLRFGLHIDARSPDEEEVLEQHVADLLEDIFGEAGFFGTKLFEEELEADHRFTNFGLDSTLILYRTTDSNQRTLAGPNITRASIRATPSEAVTTIGDASSESICQHQAYTSSKPFISDGSPSSMTLTASSNWGSEPHHVNTIQKQSSDSYLVMDLNSSASEHDGDSVGRWSASSFERINPWARADEVAERVPVASSP